MYTLKTTAIAATLSTLCLTGPALAAPVSIDFGGNTTFSNEIGGIDVFGAATVTEGVASLAGPDGKTDIYFQDGVQNVLVGDAVVQEEFGTISAFNPDPFLDIQDDLFGSDIVTDVRFITSGGSLRRFSAGDEISAAVLGSSTSSSFGSLYSGTGGVLGSIGSGGIFGFRVDVNQFTQGVQLSDIEFAELCIDVEVQPAACFGELGQIEQIDSFFGWLEIERGSINLVSGGFNTAGQGQGILAGTLTATNVNAVPLPAAGWMLLAGFGGLAAMKRRKKA